MHPFLQSLIGGVLIGLASVGLLAVNGRIAGISGILSNALALKPGPWRWAFVGGLLAVGGVLALTGTAPSPALAAQPPAGLAIAGVLVGFGTQLGSGCTSGHGVCGLSSLSLRSLTATAVFMLAAGLAVFVVRHGAPVLEAVR